MPLPTKFSILAFSFFLSSLAVAQTPQFIQEWSVSGGALALDQFGHVYTVSAGLKKVTKFTNSGSVLLEWGGSGTNDGEFIIPAGIAVDLQGNVYVGDLDADRIQKFDGTTGDYILQWGSTCTLLSDSSGCVDPDGPGPLETGDGQFHTAAGVAVDAAGLVFVADYDNARIQKFDTNGGFLGKWGGSYGSGNDQFFLHNDVAVDGMGNVYVADSGNNRIQKFSTDGTFLDSWGGVMGSAPGEFNWPFGVGVDGHGRVYVADWGNHRIQVFDGSGNLLFLWGDQGAGPGEFNGPADVVIDDVNGVLYVSDQDRIQKFAEVAVPVQPETWGGIKAKYE